MGEHYFPARVRKGGLLFSATAMLVPLTASIALLGVTEPFPAVVLFGAILGVAIAYAAAFKLRYELDDNELRYRQGIFSAWRISLRTIRRVMPVGPLDSSQGLIVEAGKQMRLVVAPDQERFLTELAARAPQLRRYGNELRASIINDYGIA